MWLDDLGLDLRYAVRTLRRAPGFTFIVVLTLALGIGANTAIFSVVHAVLLRPLPYKDSGQLVRVYENVPGPEFGNGKGPDRRFGAMDIRDIVGLSGRTRTLTHLAAYSLAQLVVAIDGDATRMEGFGVSPNMFAMLGVPALLGRTITDEDAGNGGQHVVVLGYGAWQHFGADPGIIGRTMKFSVGGGTFTGGIVPDQPYSIIGIMPAGFRFPFDNAQFWFPRVLVAPANVPPGARLSREAIARLAPGVPPEVAAAEMAAIRATIRAASAPTGKPRYELVRLRDE